MKKLLFALAAVALLVACNKNNGNEPTDPKKDDPTKPTQDTTVVINDNPVYNLFKEVLPFQGMTKTNFESSMQGAGWTKYEGTEVYGKTTANTTSELTYTTVGDGLVYKITLSVRPNKSGASYTPNMTIDYVKDVIKKISSNCEMGTEKINCRYLCAYTSIGQRYTQSPSEFAATFNAGNINGVSVYYLDSRIQNWTMPNQGEKAAVYTGVIIGFRTASPIDGSSASEFNMAFEFTDETKLDQ